MELDNLRKSNLDGMTRTEKRLNYENLQVTLFQNLNNVIRPISSGILITTQRFLVGEVTTNTTINLCKWAWIKN